VIVYFYFGSSLFERLHYLDPFCVVTVPKNSDRDGGSGGVEGRYGERGGAGVSVGGEEMV
jgi:hypothetical protein